jgi:hypothetical protein
MISIKRHKARETRAATKNAYEISCHYRAMMADYIRCLVRLNAAAFLLWKYDPSAGMVHNSTSWRLDYGCSSSATLGNSFIVSRDE